MRTRTNKYNYLKVIQQSYNGTWEDVEEIQANDSENLKYLLGEYRLLGYPTRVINRRELNK